MKDYMRDILVGMAIGENLGIQYDSYREELMNDVCYKELEKPTTNGSIATKASNLYKSLNDHIIDGQSDEFYKLLVTNNIESVASIAPMADSRNLYNVEIWFELDKALTGYFGESDDWYVYFSIIGEILTDNNHDTIEGLIINAYPYLLDLFEPDIIISKDNHHDALRAALWCVLHTHSYRGCMQRVLRLDGWTNETLAIAGSIAGGHYGDIPVEWKELVVGDLIEENN